jgi:hypothetical protein
MPITKMVATQVATPTTAGTASSITQATCVRLHNDTGGIATVGISTIVGAGTTIFFTMPANSVEFLAKLPTDVIYTTPAIKAAKVGFTN